MGLVIGVHQGEDFFVEDTRVVAERIHSTTEIDLLVYGEGAPRRVKVSDAKRALLFDDIKGHPVWVQMGSKATMDMSRLMFDAPKVVSILRGAIYREAKSVGVTFTIHAKEQLRAIAPGVSTRDAMAMVKQAAKVTLPNATHRFEGLLFKVEADVVVSVSSVNDVKRSV